MSKSLFAPPKYDLSQKYPKVLFLGNGIIHDESISWDDLLPLVKAEDKCIDKYKLEKVYAIPYSQLASAVLDVDDICRQKKYYDTFAYENIDKKIRRKTSSNEIIRQLLNLGFDAVITTNYTYEIEETMKPGYAILSDNTKRKYAVDYSDNSPFPHKDNRILLHTCNQFDNNTPSVWHMHGELRRRTSIVLNHDEYGRLVRQLLNYNYENKNRYLSTYNEMHFCSWIDYFIMGEVYVVGCGFDMSEFDLWWLLSRRVREKAPTGNIFFYEAYSEKEKFKQMALKDMNVNVKNLNTTFDTDYHDYKMFYAKALEDINEMWSLRNE